MTWEALQVPGWNDSQLTRLSEVWREPHIVSDLVRAKEADGALGLVTFDLLRQRRDSRNELMEVTFNTVWEHDQWVHDYSRERSGKIRLFLASGLWRLLWSYQDEWRFFQRWHASLESARSIEKRASYSPFSPPPLPVRSDYDERSLRRCRLYFSNTLVDDASEAALLRILFFETQREMTCAAIAIKRYELRMGKPPPDLAALIPAYLSQLPHDWMNGKPLRYRANADGTFALYSVGEDGRDDGGDTSFRTDRWGKYLWYCRDAVWPSPSSEEALLK